MLSDHRRHLSQKRDTGCWEYRACRAVGTAPRPPRPGGGPAMSRGPASAAILLLFYFFNFENYNLYFHDQMPRAAGWNRGHQLNHPRHFVLYQGLL